MSTNLISVQARAGESSPVEGMREGKKLKAEVFQAFCGFADAVINLGVTPVLLLPLLIGFRVWLVAIALEFCFLTQCVSFLEFLTQSAIQFGLVNSLEGAATQSTKANLRSPQRSKSLLEQERKEDAP